MISIKPKIERPYWNDPTPERIEDYLKELKKEKEKMKKLSWDMRDFIADDWIKGIEMEIDNEIEYCEFYFELKKKKKNKDFKKWVLKEDYKPYSHSEPRKAWICFNGKIKIIIEMNKRDKSTWINKIIDNDSEFIYFSPDGRKFEVSTKILRSKESVDKYIEEIKEDVESIFKEYKFPRYSKEKRDIDYLNFLLGVEDVN